LSSAAAKEFSYLLSYITKGSAGLIAAFLLLVVSTA
jgi:hypothetical protein